MNGKFLDGKTAVITGASQGLGRAMALALGRAGAKLALVGRAQHRLAETQQLGKEQNIESEIFICDVREEFQISKLEQEVKQRFGNVHILINNAGTAVRKNLVEFSMDEWRQVIDTNLTGVFLASRAFVPHMQANQWGRIINITSIMAHVGSVGRAAYCATKHGVLAITKSMALEHVGEGINVVAISPGFYATNLTAPLRADPQKNADLMSCVPANRWGEPKEIGEIALFLCSEGASFITGTDVVSDGGWVAQ
ncbi:MAG: SDR family oxidoreductase [Burkholderiales bacterium]|nr:SDR family oxidoreductase [Burkholderiales bacterium]